ncbi:MAG: hypothetical protein J6Q76_02930 [Clostridia bacterium]|nr:hypothetical protein [Clostridia bacterium]
MKKIFALILALLLVFSLAACGDEDRTSNTSSGPSVDANTIEIVNNAFAATKAAVDSTKALGYEMNFVYSITVDDVTTSVRAGSKIDYIDTDDGRKFAAESIIKSGEQAIESIIYDDNENVYAYGAGETYLLVGKDVEDYLAEQFDSIRVIDTANLKAADTLIVDAANNAHGFVIDYDPKDVNFDIKNYLEGFESVLGADDLKDLNINVTSVSISGIVDSTGKLSSESFKIAYEFSQQIEVPKNDVDPDNSDVSETTETVTKVFKNELSFNISYDFDLTEVNVPEEITVIGEPQEGEEEPEKPSEISVTDFGKLLMGNTSTEDEK